VDYITTSRSLFDLGFSSSSALIRRLGIKGEEYLFYKGCISFEKLASPHTPTYPHLHHEANKAFDSGIIPDASYIATSTQPGGLLLDTPTATHKQPINNIKMGRMLIQLFRF
jgi:hypothetical protein